MGDVELDEIGAIFAPEGLGVPGAGPLYLQLRRRLAAAIQRGQLAPCESLPAEREIAAMTGLSRVTVRKAVQELVASGQLVQRRGSGTFVAPRPGQGAGQGAGQVQLPLWRLNSFSEDMALRGKTAQTLWLERGLSEPADDEVIRLGLEPYEQVARLARVRLSDGVPLAIERSALPASVLPAPEAITHSLYDYLGARRMRPVRAVQRISAINIGGGEARLLQLPVGAAGLEIERIAYLDSGRVVEITNAIYRGDAYDFTAELRAPVAAGRATE